MFKLGRCFAINIASADKMLVALQCSKISNCSVMFLLFWHCVHSYRWSNTALLFPLSQCSEIRLCSCRLDSPMYEMFLSQEHVNLYTTLDLKRSEHLVFRLKYSFTFVVVYAACTFNPYSWKICLNLRWNFNDGFPKYGMVKKVLLSGAVFGCRIGGCCLKLYRSIFWLDMNSSVSFSIKSYGYALLIIMVLIRSTSVMKDSKLDETR